MMVAVPPGELKSAFCVECGEPFQYQPLRLDGIDVPTHYCPGCRVKELSLDRDRGSAVWRESEQREAEAFAALLEKESHYGDWRVIDENGDEVWARQLAKKYRKQTKPRGRWK